MLSVMSNVMLLLYLNAVLGFFLVLRLISPFRVAPRFFRLSIDSRVVFVFVL